ncbi:MAG: 50S ribosomal protein L13 [Elusimicrobia bacterium RIFCSPLOWO2_01_FULL_54_10]|nr:MAG: 50S ribosomal protein L13 [Elusimicrobia bacterium RIFCSPLOWO2_01_FULL_54_10]
MAASRKWHWIDADGIVLGRLASQAAAILMGKNKPTFTRTVDCGDFVVVTNIDKIKLTGNKFEDKHAFYHTGHPGGAKVLPYKKLALEKPQQMLQIAVDKMLPRNHHSHRQILRLKMYRGATHPHAVNHPQKIDLN